MKKFSGMKADAEEKRKDMFVLTGTGKSGLNVTEVTTWTYLAGVGKRNIFV